MEYKIFILQDYLKESGRQVAFVAGNRNINGGNLKTMKKSLEKFKSNIVPIMFVKGEKVVADGCKLETPKGQPIDNSDASKFIAILDGQHRYLAAMELQLNLFVFEAYTENSTQELLSEANIASKAWQAGDYAKGAALFSNDENVQYIAELCERGLKLPTASLFATFTRRVDKKRLSSVMQGEPFNVTVNRERSEAIYEAAEKKFSASFLASHYLIDAVVALNNDKGCDYKVIVDALNQLTKSEAKAIQNADGTQGKLDAAYQALEKYLKSE